MGDGAILIAMVIEYWMLDGTRKSLESANRVCSTEFS
jgi:hypothetical protein